MSHEWVAGPDDECYNYYQLGHGYIDCPNRRESSRRGAQKGQRGFAVSGQRDGYVLGNGGPDPQFDLDDIRTYFPPQHDPVLLYRVQHTGCQTCLSEGEDLVAQSAAPFTSDVDFVEALLDNFSYSSGTANRIINFFSEKDHAGNWCRQISEHPSYRPCHLYTLDMREMEDVSIFKLLDLAEKWTLQFPDEKAEQHIDNDYVCLYRAPAQAIVDKELIDEHLRPAEHTKPEPTFAQQNIKQERADQVSETLPSMEQRDSSLDADEAEGNGIQNPASEDSISPQVIKPDQLEGR